MDHAREQKLNLVSDMPDDFSASEDQVPRPRHRFAGSRRVASLSLVGTLAAIVGVVGFSRSSFSSLTQSSVRSIIEQVEWTSAPPCGLMERGIEYGGPDTQVNTIGQYGGVDYDTQCRHKCFLVAECQVWTWSGDKTCKLMSVVQHTAPQKIPKPGATSGGMPCGMDQMLPAGTLYCWTLMQPNSYEAALLADQYAKHLSIFNCEAFAIVSNQQTTIAPGLDTEVVNVDLSCQQGGEFGTALNLDIFIAVWKHVVQQGIFRQHEWTVKGDPDAIFFADRLRGILPHHPEEARGVYLNNCKMGMHGPVEVFSRNAVDALNNNWENCQTHFTQLCGGDCKWGEDMFIDQCLQNVVGARRDNEWLLLVEDHCLGPGEQFNTGRCDGVHVAFHPFKDTQSYSDCFSNAWHSCEAAKGLQNQEVPPPR